MCEKSEYLTKEELELAHNESIDIRVFGMYKNKGLYLSSKFIWVIERDEQDVQVLVPKRRSKECKCEIL